MEWLIGLFDEQIIKYILGAIILFLGWRYQAAKALIKEIGDLCDILGESLEDDELSEEERKSIMKEARDVFIAIKKLLGKNEEVVK
jgi:hypothetical protein